MISIKLDTNTVRDLFPEGSEARVQLQQAVIDNVVKEMVLKDTENNIRKTVQTEIHSATRNVPSVVEEIKKQLEQFYEKAGWSGDIRGTQAFSAAMREEAERHASIAISNMVREAIQDGMTKSEARIKDHMAYASIKMQDIVVKAVNKDFEAIINKAIAEKLATHFPVKAQ